MHRGGHEMAYVSFVAEGGPIYDIKKRLGVISKSRNGWTKEMNLVAWNDGEPRYELRSWSPDHSRMGKGISLSVAEMDSLREILGDIMENIPEVVAEQAREAQEAKATESTGATKAPKAAKKTRAAKATRATKLPKALGV